MDVMLHSWRQTTRATRQRVERCSILSLIGMRECSTLNRDACAREPCLRRSLRALRLKADAVAWSSLRCVMLGCAQHLYTHLHSLSHRHPTPAAGRRTTPRPSFAPSSKVLWSCLMWDDADSHPAHARCLTVVSPQRPTALARTLAAVSHSYTC